MTEATDTLTEAPAIADTPSEAPDNSIEIETLSSTDDASDESTATGDADNAEETTDPEAEKAALRQADYTRKTQELAEERKALAQRREKFDTYVTQGEALVNTLASEFQADFQNVNWGELASNDPARYVQLRHQFDERQRKLALAVGQLNAAKQQQAALDDEATQTRLQEEQKRLLDAVPEWKDSAKAAAEISEVRSFLTKRGFSPDEVNGITDQRAVILARNAMLYERLMSKVPQPKAQTSAPPPPPPAPSKAKVAPSLETMSMNDFMKVRAKQTARR